MSKFLRLLTKGDIVETPRFLKVRIEEIFENRKEAYQQGFYEPSHYDNPNYEITGKSIGPNRMIFAAVKRQ